MKQKSRFCNGGMKDLAIGIMVFIIIVLIGYIASH